MKKNKLLGLVFLVLTIFTVLLTLDSLYFFLFKKESIAKVIDFEKTKNGEVWVKLQYKRNNKTIYVSSVKNDIKLKDISLFSEIKIYYNDLWKNEFIIKDDKNTRVFIYEIILFSIVSYLFIRGSKFYINK